MEKEKNKRMDVMIYSDMDSNMDKELGIMKKSKKG